MCSPHQHRLGPPNREGRNVTVREVSRHNDGGKIIIVVVRTLGFLIVRRLLGLVGLGPREYARDVEIAVLRHQLAGAASAGRPPPPGTTRPIGHCWRRGPGCYLGTGGECSGDAGNSFALASGDGGAEVDIPAGRR
jgi:hypothetical protein